MTSETTVAVARLRRQVAGRVPARSDWRLALLTFGACLASATFGCGASSARDATASAPVTLPERTHLHLFLLVGQSNMAGRGDVEPTDRQPLPGVIALDADRRWVAALDPVHWDKPVAGVGLARSFAVEYLKTHPGVTVGLIPAACGGSPISTWQPGQYFGETNSHPYDDALARARVGQEHGTLRGILWHQGEADRSAELAPRYQPALVALIERFREELGAPGVPFLIGQLGLFPGAGPWGEWTRMVDQAHRDVAANVPAAAFVSAEGLTSKADNLHFDAASLREFGRRYAAVFAEIEARSAAATAP